MTFTIQLCGHTDTSDAWKYVFEKASFTSAEFAQGAESCVRAPVIENSQIDAIIITQEPEADKVTARRQHEDRCQNDSRAWLQARRDVSVTHGVKA